MAIRVDLRGQLQEFHSFLDNRLLPDLKRITRNSDVLQKDIEDYEKLIQEIDAIFSLPDDNPVIKVDIGCQVYATARIDDGERILVDVGKGVFVEFSLIEALRFCHEKIYYLRKWQERYLDKEAEVKAHIDMVVFNLEQLTIDSEI